MPTAVTAMPAPASPVLGAAAAVVEDFAVDDVAFVVDADAEVEAVVDVSASEVVAAGSV